MKTSDQTYGFCIKVSFVIKDDGLCVIVILLVGRDEWVRTIGSDAVIGELSNRVKKLVFC